MSVSKSFPSFLRWSFSVKKTLQKAKKLFKVSLLSLSKDLLVNFWGGKTSRIFVSLFSSSILGLHVTSEMFHIWVSAMLVFKRG